MAGSSPAMTERWVLRNPGAEALWREPGSLGGHNGAKEFPWKPCCTQECVGIGGLAPRISTIAIPCRGGSTKARLARGTATFLRKPLGDRQFRSFSVRDEAGLDGRVRSCAPRVVLRSLV